MAETPETTTQQGGSEPGGAHTPAPAGATPASATETAEPSEADIVAALKADGVDLGEPPPEETPGDEDKPAEKPTEDKPAEAKPAEETKPEEKPPETESELVKRANATMAAARRAEKRAQEALAKASAHEARAKQLDAFVEAVKKDPRQAYLQLGYRDLREYVEAISNAGSADPVQPTADDRVAALERRLEEKEAAETQRAAEARLEQNKGAVKAALEKEERFDLVLSDMGQELLWSEIHAYYQEHKSVPDEAVFAIANEVEKHLESQIARSKKFSRLGGAQKQPSAPATPKPAASTSGKGIPSTTRSAPAAPDNLPLDEHGIPDTRAVLASLNLL